MPQELAGLEVVARLDAAVVAAEEAAGAVVARARVPARVALARALGRRQGGRGGALARMAGVVCFIDFHSATRLIAQPGFNFPFGLAGRTTAAIPPKQVFDSLVATSR